MKKWLLLVFVLIPLCLKSQHIVAHRCVSPGGYHFYLYTPATDTVGKHKTPVVVFLHGRSLCGTNLSKVRRYGTINAIEKGKKLNAIVIAPQNPGARWNPGKIMDIVNWTVAHTGADTNRIYVLGMSLGGYGTIDFAAAYPDKVAAAMALCGGGSSKNYCGLGKVPLWILHGTADRSVGVGESVKVVNAMVACGDTSRLIFTKLPGASHGRLARIFYLSEAYEWLFEHSLQDSNRAVNRRYTINNEMLNDVYKQFYHPQTKVAVVDTITPSKQVSSTASSGPSSEAAYYTIKKGDTLGGIAKRHHTTVSKLCQLNGMKSNTTLRIGRKIRVK